MSIQASFYQVMGGTPAALDATVPLLIEKALGAGHKVLIRCPSEERMERLNDTLWSYKAESFIPHGTVEDGDPKLQTVLLTTGQENLNGSDLLITISGAESDDLSDFKRVMDMFENNDSQKKNARKRWKDLKEQGLELNYFAHEEGRWQKKM